MLGYVMLCYDLKYVRYVLLGYVHCVDCQFCGGASGTRRTLAHGRIGESDGDKTPIESDGAR